MVKVRVLKEGLPVDPRVKGYLVALEYGLEEREEKDSLKPINWTHDLGPKRPHLHFPDDKVDVYWSDDTDKFSVYVNGGLSDDYTEDQIVDALVSDYLTVEKLPDDELTEDTEYRTESGYKLVVDDEGKFSITQATAKVGDFHHPDLIITENNTVEVDISDIGVDSVMTFSQASDLAKVLENASDSAEEIESEIKDIMKDSED